MDLFPNSTFWIQLAIFFSVVAVLSWGVFAPITKLLLLRAAKLDAGRGELGNEVGELREKITGAEAELLVLRARALKARDQILSEAHREENSRVAAAREKADTALRSCEERLKKEMTAVEATIEGKAKGLAAQIAARILPLVIAVFGLILTSSPVFASEGEGAAHSEGVPFAMVFQLFNFAVLVFLLFKFLKKPAQAFFVKRRTDVERAIAGAEAEKRVREEEVAHLKARYVAVQAELSTIEASIVSAATAEKEERIRRAQELASQLVADGEARVRDEEIRAEAEFRRHLLTRAFSEAGALLSEKLADGALAGRVEAKSLANWEKVLAEVSQ